MPPIAERVRFGPFELDPLSGELYKRNHRLNLHGQPIEVLALLLEHPGQLVTREEIRCRLWAEDTFVDFEHSLNTAIKKLRQALDDDPDAPHYIETLPRKGYRFIAPVEADVNVADPVAALTNNINEPSTGKVGPESAAPSKSLSPPKPRRPRWVAIIVLLAAAAGTLLWFIRPRTPVVTASHQLTNTGRHKTPYLARHPVSDGTRIYFAEKYPDKWYISQIAVSGGDMSRIDTPLMNPHLLDISADGSELLVQDFSLFHFPLWIVSLPSGSLRRVGDVQTIEAQFVPDSDQIAYANDDRLVVVNKDGTNAKTLLTAPGGFAKFSYSPNGQTIRLTIGRDLWEANRDGSGLRRFLPEHKLWSCCGAYSPDGKLFLFSSVDEEAVLVNLWAVREEQTWPMANPSRPVQLTFGPTYFLVPTLSRNGKQILIFGEQLKGELQVYDEKSGLFGPYLSGISAGYVSFSRDGQWAAYVTYPEGRLWRSRVDGSERMQLSFPPTLQIANPRWSPDGKLILFVETRMGSAAGKGIYAIPAAGGSPLLLLAGNWHDPNWSPDGESIVYSDGPSPTSLVRIMSLKDRQSRPVPGSEGYFSPRWSPDGRYLSALSHDAKKLALYSFQSNRWQVVSVDEHGFTAFSHDSRYLYFSHGFANGPGEIVKLRLADGKIEKAADTSGIETTCPILRVPSWFALTPDDRVLVLRDRGIDELYALDLAYR